MSPDPNDEPAAGTEFYRDEVGIVDRLVRLVGTTFATLVAFVLIDDQQVRLTVSCVVFVGGLVYSLAWPLQQYVVRQSQLTYFHWPRQDSVDLDELVRVEVHWVLYAGNTLRFDDRSGRRLTVPISTATHELRMVIGQRLQVAHPMIARTSVIGTGVAGPLGLVASSQ